MHTDAINGLSFTSRQHRPQKRKAAMEAEQRKQYEQYQREVPNSKMSKATKGMAVALMMLPAVTTMMPSCGKDAYAYAEAHATATCDSCGCPHVIHNNDTIWVHDSIPVVIPQHDTIYIQENFESPVIDTLKSLLGDLGIDLGNGYVPVRMSYVDEMDTKFNKHLFDGRSSSKDLVIYDTKQYGWDDYNGTFNMDDYLADKSKIMLSLTRDGELYISKLVPKPGIDNPQSLSDYRVTDLAHKVTRGNAHQLNKYVEHNSDGVFVFDGTLEKGDMPQSIMLTNPYGTSWRWTNFDVESMDVPKKK